MFEDLIQKSFVLSLMFKIHLKYFLKIEIIKQEKRNLF